MNSSPLILSLETATLGGSVFLGRGAVELATRLGDPAVSHSNSLLRDIETVLEQSSLRLSEVELLACASGPGSFTGLRIGIATVKGLAATLGLPVVGVPTLKAVAHAAGPSDSTVALLPAGRGELFSQMFKCSRDGEATAVDTPAHLSPERLMTRYGSLPKVIWAGSGAHVQREFLKGQAEVREISFEVQDSTNATGWTIAEETKDLARNVAALAIQQFISGQVDSPQSLSALYVRPSDAELKQQCR